MAEFRTSAWVEHNLEVQRSAARGLGTIWKCCVSWAQFGSAAHGLGTVWKCRVGWAQVGSAGFSRAGHNLNAPASRELGTIWKCNLRVRHNLEAQLAGLAQFGNARFSRVWHEIEALISHVYPSSKSGKASVENCSLLATSTAYYSILHFLQDHWGSSSAVGLLRLVLRSEKRHQ